MCLCPDLCGHVCIEYILQGHKHCTSKKVQTHPVQQIHGKQIECLLFAILCLECPERVRHHQKSQNLLLTEAESFPRTSCSDLLFIIVIIIFFFFPVHVRVGRARGEIAGGFTMNGFLAGHVFSETVFGFSILQGTW